MKKLRFLHKVILLFCLFWLLVLLSCGVSTHLQTSGSGGWEMDVVLDQGYRLEVLQGSELNIVPVYDDLVVSSSYRILFKLSDGFRLEGMKARLLSLGALKVDVVRRD